MPAEVAAVTVPVTAIVSSVVPAVEMVIFPDGLPVAVDAILAKTLVAFNVPDAVIVTEEAKPVELFKETSKPVGAVIVTLLVKFVPETANDWVDDADPAQLVKLDNVVGFTTIEGATTGTAVLKAGPTEKSK